MEVYDQLNRVEVIVRTRPGLKKADDNPFVTVIYQILVHFLMSLNSRGTFSRRLGLIFNELELCIKMLVIMVVDIRPTVNTMFF